MKSGGKTVLFVIYLIFGLYFINDSINLMEMPGFLEEIKSWILLFGGVLILLGGVNYLRASKYSYSR